MGKSMSTLVIQPSFRAVGQTQAKWQTFKKKTENKGQMYSPPEPDYHTFVSYFQVFQMPAISHVLVLRSET